jgi:SnoaL-like domain
MRSREAGCVDVRHWRPVSHSLRTPSQTCTREMSHAQERVWSDVGLVAFVLDQTYTMDGQQQTISAPTSVVFVRQDSDWKIAPIHTVPIAQQA